MLPEYSGDLMRLLPDDAVKLEIQDFDGQPINELTIITVDGATSVHPFELIPSRGYIAVFPDDWPPAYEVRGFEPTSHGLAPTA